MHDNSFTTQCYIILSIEIFDYKLAKQCYYKHAINFKPCLKW